MFVQSVCNLLPVIFMVFFMKMTGNFRPHRHCQDLPVIARHFLLYIHDFLFLYSNFHFSSHDATDENDGQ